MPQISVVMAGLTPKELRWIADFLEIHPELMKQLQLQTQISTLEGKREGLVKEIQALEQRQLELQNSAS